MTMFLFHPMLSVSYWPLDSVSMSSFCESGSSVEDCGRGGVKKRPQMQRLLKNRMPRGKRLQRSRKVAMKEKQQSLRKDIHCIVFLVHFKPVLPEYHVGEIKWSLYQD